MDTRQLQTLLAVADTGSFAAAAAVVNLTPSAVSQQIQALEVELGASLFDRTHRPPLLNSKGMEVLQSARTILQVVTETRRAISGGQIRGTLNLGSIRTASMMLIPQALAQMQTVYPELSFDWRVGLSETLMSDVVAGRLDTAIVAEHVGVPPGLTWTPFLSEPLLLIGPPNTSGMEYEQLIAEQPFIRYTTNVPLSRQIDTELSRLGVVPRKIAEINTVPAIISCVYAGLGIAVVPRITLLEPTAAQLVSHIFGTPPIYRRLGVVQRQTSAHSEVIRRLVETLSEISHAFDVGYTDEM